MQRIDESEPPVDNRAVDVFLEALVDPRPDRRSHNKDYRPKDTNDTAYSRKVKADPAAISNYDSLPRPLKPPAAKKVYEWDDVKVTIDGVELLSGSAVKFDLHDFIPDEEL